jgi:bifunctional non-homologous end joining protein LigD
MSRVGTPVTTMEVDGRSIRITNPDRILWPRTGTTKRELVGYYLDAAPVLLPHLLGRGLTLGRWPAGVDQTGWLQAECRGRPDWLPVHEVTTRAGGRFAYCMVDGRAGLAWLANLGTIELHPFLAPAARPNEPSFLVFDLDPGPPAGLADAARVALDIRDRLSMVGIASWPKTSGMAGVHVYAPLAPGHTFAETKPFVRAIARDLAGAAPERVTDRVPRRERAGRVFIDWVQNDASRSTVAAYSVRAAPFPTVSMPLTWSEVEDAVGHGNPPSIAFDIHAALARIADLGDPFACTLGPGARLTTEATIAATPAHR